jgi:predicted 3-demethylubiquinone-9 3-methyltransferase (glyoxalase superfamily)
MRTKVKKITPFLWFDNRAEEAVKFYTSIFRNSGILRTTRYEDEGTKATGMPTGAVMTVEFRIEDQEFVALNGGPHFTLSEAISFVVNCDSQDEVDYYWEKLSEGGDPKAQQCGWLKDKYGVSWQVIPTALPELLNNPDPEISKRVMKTMLQMKKIEIEPLKRASQERAA